MNKVITTDKKRTTLIILIGLAVCIIAALIIKIATAHFIPTKAYFTYFKAINCLKNKEIIKIITKEGIITPNVAKILPKILFFLYPI
mgnify:CR=1 FL=1